MSRHELSAPLSRPLLARPLLALSLGAGLAAALAACGPKAAPVESAATPAIVYPAAARGDVVDDYHGTLVPDPYRWLEDTDAPETRAWIEAQNSLTRSWIDAVPERPAIQARLHELWNYERFGVPFHQEGRYFWSRNDGLQNQSVVYTATALDAEPQILLDPNTWSSDGTVSLATYAVDEQARRVAYATSDGGSDWNTWHVKDIETGQVLPDELNWSKFSGVSWLRDGSGFFYSRFPQPETALADVNEHNKLYLHRLGTPQDQDQLIFEAPANPRRGWEGHVTDDGRWLVITGTEGTENKSRIYLKSLDKGWEDDAPGQGVIKLLDAYDAGYYLISTEQDRLWFWTNKDAPRGKVIAVDAGKPDPASWTEVVPQNDAVLDYANRVGDHLVLTYTRDAKSEVKVVTLDGAFVRDVTLPGVGTVSGFAGDPDRDETFYSFTGFTDPSTIYRYDVGTGQSTLFKRPNVAFDPAQYETKQVFYTSKDGTKVPMFITHKKGIVLDGTNPTILYGYGGFNISLTPWFSVSNQVWMEMGGVYAVANLRGGGEYGEEWHEAGTLGKKQNVFDDFYAAAEWLQVQGYTRPDKLAIHGGSNGGLLVGAAITQRPELFGAAIPAVGVLDMLRYHTFTIGWAWASDYGTSADPEQFPFLYAYSPLHNVKPGTAYPPTLVTTGDHDDRVVPGHSFKFTAALQAAQGGTAPILTRIETRAGHGAGKPTTMVIEETADRFAFLVRALGMKPQGLPAAKPATPAAEAPPAGHDATHP
ncbi:prolyl oligopeptidase family serine peptidase [Myxococcota bacterium]|nr:prolyl oligopeptidase family serine peptidase [Myxococcota bacterium]